MSISPLTLRADPIHDRSGSKAPTEAQKLADATRQFEALLIRQILSQARQTVIKSKLTDNSAAADIYKDMVNAELAEAMAQSGGLGLAATLERQLSRPASSHTAKGQPPASHD